MERQIVRFGLLSVSPWARRLLDAAAEVDRLEFRGVCTRDPAKAQEVTAQYGGVAYPSYGAMLADPEIDAVLLPTPNHLHHRHASEAFAAGKHVFVEKPIAGSVDEARDMRRMAQELHLVLAVGHQGRRTGAARMIKAMLEDGRLGRIVLVVATHGAPLLASRPEGSWYFSAATAPGGPLDQLGVHYFDLLMFLFGPVRTVKGAYSRRHAPHDVPDAASAILEMADGTIASYNTHQVSAYVSNLSIYGSEAAVHLRRFGIELLWEDVIPPAQSKQDGPSIRSLPIDGPQPFTTALQEELAEFAECIRTGTTPSVGADEGIAALRVARAVIEAHDSGRTIVL